LRNQFTDTQGRSILLNCLELVGGIAELAKRLNVSEQQVAEWLAGRSSPPPEVMVNAVEAVLKAPPRKG
jgi:transcriptional regulator with XRE-family HTH domain